MTTPSFYRTTDTVYDKPVTTPTVNKHWNRPVNKISETNYGYGVNYYQPMVDKLNVEESTGYKRRSVGKVPYSEERGRPEFDPARPIKPYTDEQMNYFSDKFDKSADSTRKYAITYSSTANHVQTASISMKVQARVEAYKKQQAIEKIKEENRKKDRLEQDRKDAQFEEGLDMGVQYGTGVTDQMKTDIESQLKADALGSVSGDMDFNRFLRKRTYNAKFDDDKHIEAMEDRKAINEQQERDLDNILCSTGVKKSDSYTLLPDIVPEKKTSEERDMRDAASYSKTLTIDRLMEPDNKGRVAVLQDRCKQMTIEIEQLNAKLVEAETRLKTEVVRIKKKLQIQITELEMSLDVANKNNIELQKTVKKMSLQLTEMGGHYDEVQRQLQVTLDQLGVSQRRVQALQAELEEMRGNLDAAMRAKRSAETSYEEAHTRVNELTTINVNLSAAKSKLEQEYGSISADYDEISKELRMADDRVQKTQVELKHTLDILHEEQERVVKIESIKKSLEIEVKNVSMRLEEVESNAIAGGKRIIGKLESRVRDLEMELDSEKRCHSETTKVLRKKERHVKELMLASDEDRNNVHVLQEQIDKMSQKCNLYKRQLDEQESSSSSNLTRVRRFQRELEAAEERAETAESNLSLVRAKHRTFVTSSQVPGLSSSYTITETSTKETM